MTNIPNININTIWFKTSFIHGLRNVMYLLRSWEILCGFGIAGGSSGRGLGGFLPLRMSSSYCLNFSSALFW
jgi:hypothetical protein